MKHLVRAAVSLAIASVIFLAVSPLQADPGRNQPRCIQFVNEIRAQCDDLCFETCTVFLPGGITDVDKVCLNDCHAA